MSVPHLIPYDRLTKQCPGFDQLYLHFKTDTDFSIPKLSLHIERTFGFSGTVPTYVLKILSLIRKTGLKKLQFLCAGL